MRFTIIHRLWHAAEDERVDSHLLSAMYSSVMTDERPEQETSYGLNPPPPAGEPIRRPLPAGGYPAQAYGAEQVSGLERRGSEELDSKRQHGPRWQDGSGDPSIGAQSGLWQMGAFCEG